MSYRFLFRRTNQVLATFLLVFLSSFSSSAAVKSMSLEKLLKANYEVSLKCSGDRQPRIIRKEAERAAQWCSIDQAGLCHKIKYTLARRVCKYSKDEFAALRGSNGVAETSASPAVAVVDKAKANAEEQRRQLRLEQMLIEEQRIKLEQRRLELVQLELKLKRELSSK